MSGSGIASTQSPADAETLLYSLDRSFHPDSMRLVGFSSDPVDPLFTEIGAVDTTFTDPVSADMDFGPNGLLFMVPYFGVVHAIDPATGAVAASLSVLQSVEGLAVDESGLIYLSDEHQGGRIWTLDWASGDLTLLVGSVGEIDDLDFDGDGNLIGSDINSSGRIYRIPLDGAPPVLIATIPRAHMGAMTFSESDRAFYFMSDEGLPGQELWKLPWFAGAPAGPLEFVEQIGPGQYVGIAALPVPDCLGDVTGDNYIGLDDLGFLLADYQCHDVGCRGDVNSDGSTNVTDLGLLLAGYGTSCP